MVPLRSQGFCGVGRGPSGLHWVWCNGRGPHLVLRKEPQGSSPFLTPISGFLQSWDRRVRPRILWRNEISLASRVVHEVTGHCRAVCETCGIFQKMHGCAGPLLFVPSSTGMPSKKCPGIGFLLIADREMGSFRMWQHYEDPIPS